MHSKSAKERQISYVQKLIIGTFDASVTHAGDSLSNEYIERVRSIQKTILSLAFESNF